MLQHIKLYYIHKEYSRYFQQGHFEHKGSITRYRRRRSPLAIPFLWGYSEQSLASYTHTCHADVLVYIVFVVYMISKGEYILHIYTKHIY